MKIVWLFPPSGGSFPNVSQYRFFKRMPIRASIIYPYLASSGVTQLIEAGHQVLFIDAPTEDKTPIEVTDLITEFQPDVVVMEARTPIIHQTWRWCDIIKKLDPTIQIIFYGDHVTWNPSESIGYHCDYVVSGGDYDRGVTALCNYLDQAIRTSRVFDWPLLDDLDSLPFVNRELVNWQQYSEAWRHRDTFLWTMSARGCWYPCTFCAWATTLWHGKIRFRSVKNVADEYGKLYAKYGEVEVLDDADIFVTQWGVQFAKELIEREFIHKEVLWACQTHPNEIYDLEKFKLMRKSGLRTVKLGIETLNQRSLNLIRKNTTVKQVEKAINILKEANIMVHANLMVGFPWETREHAEQTINFIKKLDPNQAQFSLLIPYPNTELYEEAKRNNWLLMPETDWRCFDASSPMLTMQGLTSEEIVQLYQDHWSKFYFDWKYILRHISKVRHLEGVKQLWRGFRSVKFGHMRAVRRRISRD